MLPAIVLVLSVEMIRDGGSLAAVFQGSDSAEYWLFFKVRTRALPTGEIERFGYEVPVVVERSTNLTVECSWPQAFILLEQVRPMLTSELDRKWFDAMCSVAATAGQLPASISRNLGVPMRLQP